MTITGSAGQAQVTGLAARTTVTGASATTDRLTVNLLAGADVADASGLAANAILLTVNGGDGDDILIGGDGNDVLLGAAGDDVLIGGPGNDTADGGVGDNVVIQSLGANTVKRAEVAGKQWLTTHARTVKGKTVLEVDGKKRTLPRATIKQLARVV